MVVQKRGQFGNPGDYFSRDMKEYVGGFGDPSTEFWLGLDKILLLTRNEAELRIDLETFEVTDDRADRAREGHLCFVGEEDLCQLLFLQIGGGGF